MGINIHALIFTPADIAEESDGGANVGAYVRAGSDGDLITSTNNGGKESLDVNVSNTVAVSVNASYAEDTAVVSGDFVIGAGVQRHDANTSTVSADGDYSHMHVNGVGGLKTSLISTAGNDLTINADGSINVNADISVVTGFEKAEDSAHGSGDIGGYVLAVRQDTLASSTSADGDYGSFKTDSRGALYTAPVGFVADDAADGGQFSVKIGGVARATAAALDLADAGDKIDVISNLSRHLLVADMATQALLQQVVTVTDTAALLVATPLANRKKVEIQNDGDKPIYIGDATVTGDAAATGGFKIPKGDSYEVPAAGGVAIYAITASGSNTGIRVLEYA